MSASDDEGEGTLQAGSRRAGRLAAVQALYQIKMMGTPARQVIDEFLLHGFSFAEGEEVPPDAVDRALFSKIVMGVSQMRDEIDAMITANLSPGWSFERLEPILLSILRAGVFELTETGKLEESVPFRVVISEYVDITHGFFAGKEPAFVNALLDRLAHLLREGELEGKDGGKRNI